MPQHDETSVPLIPRMAGKQRDIAREAENLLAGLTIDGRRTARRFLFSRDEATRRQAIQLACEVMECVRARPPRRRALL